MGSHPSDGPSVKNQRAKHHIYELDAEIQAFLQSDPYRIFSEEETDSGDKIWRVNVRQQPPSRWSAIIGDAIHNLRSALDLLVYQLVLANNASPTDATSFPVFKSVAHFEAGGLGKVKGVSATAERMIRELKPYQGGNEALWRLHRLDIADKHHLLLATGAAYASVIVDFSGHLKLKSGRRVPPMPIALKPEDRQCPLEDGATVFKVMKAVRDPEQDIDRRWSSR